MKELACPPFVRSDALALTDATERRSSDESGRVRWRVLGAIVLGTSF